MAELPESRWLVQTGVCTQMNYALGAGGQKPSGIFTVIGSLFFLEKKQLSGIQVNSIRVVPRENPRPFMGCGFFLFTEKEGI